MAKGSDEENGDTSDARWLRDGMGGTEQLVERASPIPPNLTGHGHTLIHMPSTSCTLGRRRMGLMARCYPLEQLQP